MTSDVENQLQQLKKLIQMERLEDQKIFTQMVLDTPIEEKKARGVTCYPIVINKEYLGLGGKLVLEISSQPKTNHLFTSGAVISLFAEKGRGKKNPFIGAIVASVENNNIVICLHEDELPEWADSSSLGIDLGNDEKTFIQMEEAIDKVISAKNCRLQELRDAIFGVSSPKFYTKNNTINLDHLNVSQKEAVDKTLYAQDIAIIHGPPGTGKTTTLIASICETLKTENQVLVCAPSNAAVDLLTVKLIECDVDVIRLGHPARIQPHILESTLDAKILKHRDHKILKKWRKEVLDLRAQALKFHKHFDRQKRQERKEKFQESRLLLKEIERLEKAMCNDVLHKSQAIICTLTVANSKILQNIEFPVVFIDEAAQALEGACWIPITKARKVVMAGDHCQLPPTVKSRQASKEGLGVSLMEKCAQRQEIATLLKVQYRMHQQIMDYSNRVFYDNKLEADLSVKERSLGKKISVVDFVDTAGCGFEEECNQKNKSRYNPGEAKVLFQHFNRLLTEIDYHELSVGIISPYKEQVLYLRDRLLEQVKIRDSIGSRLSINTIDSFQGQERDIIYISLVRSNNNGEIGFLKDIRRMNVAMTRAKKKLVVIGDSATISSESFYCDFLEYIEEIESYTSAWEFMDM
ncbi:AAA domain-containing protein [Candidatus Uabimicrobium sp. HlEnr_7]|uniref:AAA domain-containing protein n=1 Tax=Candidatus Uabimicrobium helgolandensis TaxID=3095367 RepID=UPI003558533E